MGEASGMVDAAREALDEAGPPQLQASLFPSAELATLPEGASARAEALRKRGPGRPPGAVNRRSLAFREYVLQRGNGEHPLDGMIETYCRPVRDLAAELGCTPLEALKLQLDCRKVVAEYTEGKMPVTVNMTGAGVIPVIFEPFQAAPQGVIEGEFFQPLSGEAEGELDNAQLDKES